MPVSSCPSVESVGVLDVLDSSLLVRSRPSLICRSNIESPAPVVRRGPTCELMWECRQQGDFNLFCGWDLVGLWGRGGCSESNCRHEALASHGAGWGWGKKMSNQSKKWVTQLCICPDRLNTKETGSLSCLLPIPFCTLVLSPILSNASNPCLNWLSLWHDYGRVQKVHRLVFWHATLIEEVVFNTKVFLLYKHKCQQ